MSVNPPPGPVSVLRGHRKDVQSIDFTPEGSCIVAGDAEGEISVWSLITNRKLLTKKCHSVNAGVLSLRVLEGLVSTTPGENLDIKDKGDGFTVVTQGRDGSIKVWPMVLFITVNKIVVRDVCPDAPSVAIETGCFSFCRFGFLAPGEDSPALIALPGNDGNSTLVYAVRGGALQHRVDHADVRQEQGMATSMCLAAASREEEETGTAPSFPAALGGVLLFSGYEDGSVILWRMEAGRGEKLTVVKLHGEPVTAMAVARDGRLLVTGGADSRISFATVSWGGEGSGGQQSACSIKLKRSETLQRPGINHVGVRPDGRIIVTSGWDGKLRVFSAKTLKPLAILQYHAQQATTVAFSPDSTRMASAGRDNAIALWSVFSPKGKV